MPTQTEDDRLAQELIADLESLAARIPQLRARHPKTSRIVQGHRTVPRKFLHSMISVVGRSKTLQNVRKFDVDEARAALQFEAAFRPLFDRMAALTANLGFTIDARVAAVAGKALQTYTIAKGIARDPSGNTDLYYPLQRLKRDLGRKGPKKKKLPTR